MRALRSNACGESEHSAGTAGTLLRRTTRRSATLAPQTYLLEAETSDRRDVFGCSEVRLGLIASDGLTDRSRRPYRHANQLPVQIEMLIVRCKQDKPHWGAPKIRERLARLYPDVHTPAISTVHAVLDRHGLVKRRTRRRNRAEGTTLSRPLQPNELWCADYKGEFMLADRRYCYPLTISDFASRYLIACEALHTTKETYAFTVFESVFKEFGLPHAPFAAH